jgi:hypothetical protein
MASRTRTQTAILFALLLIHVCGMALASTPAARAQGDLTLDGPIAALWSDGERLWIGRGTTLIEAEVTLTGVRALRIIEIGRHELRDIAGSAGFVLALTEDGTATLNRAGEVVAFAPGGGQRLTVAGDRVYVAALQGGVRVLHLGPDGHLTRLGIISTLGPALSVSPVDTNQIWVAEGDSGVRLYDVSAPDAPRVLLWISDRVPATAVYVKADQLLIGHGGDVSILDAADSASPRLVGVISIDGVADGPSSAPITDLVAVGSRVFAGRTDRVSGGAEVVELEITSTGEARTAARLGSGERLALLGDNLFSGSAVAGLRRYTIGRGVPMLIAAWEAAPASDRCTAQAPLDPSPPDLGETGASPVTLSWRAPCAAGFTLMVNGTSMVLPTPPAGAETHTYTFTPPAGTVIWQVTVYDDAGTQVTGPVWRFEANPPIWLATPPSVPVSEMVFTSPLLDLNSPFAVMLVTCLALCAGLAVIIGAAWALGVRAQRRAIHRL